MQQHINSQDQRFSSIVPNEMMLMGWYMMQMPPIIATAWWNMAMRAWLPYLTPHHQNLHFHDEHDQLVVPDPIEKQGERALFA